MLHYRALPDAIDQYGKYGFGGIAATSDPQSDGLALSMGPGADISRFTDGRGPILMQHDVNVLIGVVTSIRKTNTQVKFDGRFVSEGISKDADEARGLLKDGIACHFSAGFEILETEPLDPKNRRAGLLVTKWRLLEISLCTVPVDPAAVVTGRARVKHLPLAARQAEADRLDRIGRRTAAEVLFPSHDQRQVIADDLALQAEPFDRARRQAEARRLQQQ